MTARSTKKGKAFGGHRTAKRREGDFYETPYSCTQQFLEMVYPRPFGTILEPAAGSGAIVKVLERNGYKVTWGDISTGQDFLTATSEFDCIVTNPPYSIANQFIEHAKKIAKYRFYFLMPLDYLGGQGRYEKRLYRHGCSQNFPLESVYIFTRKILFGDPLREDGKYETGMLTYAWYVWDRLHSGPPEIHWIDNQAFVLNKITR